MSLESRLANELIREHPVHTASVLEGLGLDESVRILEKTDAPQAASVLRRMSPHSAGAIMEALDGARIASLLEALPLDAASRMARRLSPERRAEALDKTDARLARAIGSLLRFDEGSAGALMDPNVLALPDDMTAKNALDRVRENPETARYNVYVVDHEQKLVGALNLRELLLASPGARLADFMVRDPQRLPARADRAAVVSHAGWREVHALPVVDEGGCYLGAIRYRTLRELEDQLRGDPAEDADSRDALGQLFAAGARGLMDAISSPGTTRPGGRQ